MDGLEDKALVRVAFNADGQLLAIAGVGVHVYVTRVPVLGGACGVRVAVLSSLTEVTVHHDVVDEEPPVSFTVDTEPTFIAVGVEHIAVGMNNRATFFHVSRAGVCTRVRTLTCHLGGERVRECEYIGGVQRMHMCPTHVAAFMDGRVQLHRVGGPITSIHICARLTTPRRHPSPRHLVPTNNRVHVTAASFPTRQAHRVSSTVHSLTTS
jgi:WD repeat-containing protein 19